jgi:hypothetical protein
MGKLPIPAPKDITAEWLTDALRSTGAIEGASVTAFDLQANFAAGIGFMGELGKLSLQYDKPNAGPDSIIAKFPAAAKENREIAEIFRFYEIETRFYEQIAPEIELNTPDLYYSDIDVGGTGDFILLLQDLAPAKCADQIAGMSPMQADLAVRELAKFHATWWNSPRLKDYDWMWAANNPVRAGTSQASYQQAWGPFVENFGKGLPPEIIEVGEQFGEKMLQILDQLAAEPVTLSHGDYRPDNLFFGTPEGGAPLAVIDWQILSLARGTFDFGYFMNGTLPPAERKEREQELIKLYHDTLLEGGVTGYSFDDCWEDYRLSSLFCWLYTVIALGTLDVANERGLAVFTANIERNVSTMTDFKAGELLPA